MSKRKIISIVCFSLAVVDLLVMIINITTSYLALAYDMVTGLPANTAFLLAIPYGFVLIGLSIAGMLLSKPKKSQNTGESRK